MSMLEGGMLEVGMLEVGMLELGRAGTAGTEKGTMPVLHGRDVVATLRPGRWRQESTAAVGGEQWCYGTLRRELVGRRAADPEDAPRYRARMTSLWTGAWALDLEGTAVDVRTTSMWKGRRRYSVGGRSVAESGTTGGWLRLPTLDADESLGLEVQVFLLWLELIIRRRSGGAAAGAAAAGGAG